MSRKRSGVAEAGYRVVAVTSIRLPDEPDLPIEIQERLQDGRLQICAYNEAGFNGVEIDLLDVIAWVRANRPDLLGTP